MIEGVIREVVSRDPPWSRAADILSADGQTLSADGQTWKADDVTERLDEFVERRHRIAHSGDMLPGKDSTQTIQRPYVEEAARVIRAVGEAVNDTVS